MFIFLRPFLPYIIAAVVALAGFGGLYAWVRYQGVVAEREAQYKKDVERYKAAVAKAATISEGLEQKLAQTRAEVLKLNERLNDEVTNNPVYVECRVPADGVRVLNQALAGGSAAR